MFSPSQYNEVWGNGFLYDILIIEQPWFKGFPVTSLCFTKYFFIISYVLIIEDDAKKSIRRSKMRKLDKKNKIWTSIIPQDNAKKSIRRSKMRKLDKNNKIWASIIPHLDVIVNGAPISGSSLVI